MIKNSIQPAPRSLLLCMAFAILLPSSSGKCSPHGGVIKASPSIYFGIINDNYTGTRELGIKGYYIGPDDFLTVSGFLRLEMNKWQSALVYNVLTSRKFNFRYDLIQASVSHSFVIADINLNPQLGLVWKGQFGGEAIQNWFHRGKNLPELALSHTEADFGAIIGALGSWQRMTERIRPGKLTAALELRLVTDILPSRLTPMLGYQTAFWDRRLQIEALGGYRTYLNEADEYSELIRSGLFMGLNLKYRIYQDLYFDFGMSFFPAQNLQNEALFKNKSHEYIPQITMVLSWKSAGSQVYKYLDY